MKMKVFYIFAPLRHKQQSNTRTGVVEDKIFES
jgi:hypothetical protein